MLGHAHRKASAWTSALACDVAEPSAAPADHGNSEIHKKINNEYVRADGIGPPGAANLGDSGKSKTKFCNFFL